LKNSTFTILTTFTLFVIIGFALLPLLEVSLLPNRSQPSITVQYAMSHASGEVIDAEITTPLEGVMSTLSGLVKLRSKTGKGSGRITLTFDKEVDMDTMRFEVSALMRQLKSVLPSTMSAPSIYSYNPDDKSAENLLIYAINGKGDKAEIRQVLEGKVMTALSEIEGVHNIQLSGAESKEWHLRYDARVLEQANISISDIRDAFRNQYFDYDLGMVSTEEMEQNQRIPLVFSGRQRKEVNWESIRFTKNGRVYYLTDLVDITLEKASPRSYVRINGLNTIYLYISSTQGANQLRCGKAVKAQVKTLKEQLPVGYSFTESYDATVFVKDEIKRVFLRIGFSLFLLLLFVFVVNRSWRYVLVTIISIMANLSIAFIFYYLFHIKIHIYSMAGITVSLGIIIDNTIVMTDHLKYHQGDRKVFLPIMASTLTTVGSLVIVFFLEESQRMQLLDFAYVISINLLVSLVVALFFVPALVDKIHLFERYKPKNRRAMKRVMRFTRFYDRLVGFATRRRVLFILLVILLFGFPMSKLPLTVDEDGWGATAYNNTIGTEWYGKYLKKPVNIAFGGFLNPFISKVKHNFSGSSNRRTELNIKGRLPQGAT
jgi:multidrug efflux pump subunit AcrB